MKRGDLVTVALTGDFGKPRPALVIQSDRFDESETLTVLLLAGDHSEARLSRVNVEPTPVNGLSKRSQVMIDKAMSVKRHKIGRTIGRLEEDAMIDVNRLMALFFGLA